jgi:hypothetical protein
MIGALGLPWRSDDRPDSSLTCRHHCCHDLVVTKPSSSSSSSRIHQTWFPRQTSHSTKHSSILPLLSFACISQQAEELYRDKSSIETCRKALSRHAVYGQTPFQARRDPSSDHEKSENTDESTDGKQNCSQ